MLINVLVIRDSPKYRMSQINEREIHPKRSILKRLIVFGEIKFKIQNKLTVT